MNLYSPFFLSRIGTREAGKDLVPTNRHMIIPDLEFWMVHYPAVQFFSFSIQNILNLEN